MLLNKRPYAISYANDVETWVLREKYIFQEKWIIETYSRSIKVKCWKIKLGEVLL